MVDFNLPRIYDKLHILICRVTEVFKLNIRKALIAGMLMLLSICAYAQEKPSMDLPTFPGGETSMEVNLSNEDILPTMKAMLPMLSGKMGSIAQKINPDEIAAVLKDVKRIQVLQVDVNKSGVTDSDITNYYSKNLPTGNWNRIFWQSAPKIGTLAVYVQGTGDSLYGFRVQTVTVDGKPAKQVMIGKIEGKIDFAKLLSIAGRFVSP